LRCGIIQRAQNARGTEAWATKGKIIDAKNANEVSAIPDGLRDHGKISNAGQGLQGLGDN